MIPISTCKAAGRPGHRVQITRNSWNICNCGKKIPAAKDTWFLKHMMHLHIIHFWLMAIKYIYYIKMKNDEWYWQQHRQGIILGSGSWQFVRYWLLRVMAQLHNISYRPSATLRHILNVWFQTEESTPVTQWLRTEVRGAEKWHHEKQTYEVVSGSDTHLTVRR